MFEMKKLEKENLAIAQKFFKEIKFYMAKTALQGYMGEVFVDDIENPDFAYVLLGRFCFVDGNPNNKFAKQAISNIDDYYKTIIANENWYEIIEEVYKNGYELDKRFSIKKDTKFDKEKLEKFILELNDEYKIEKINQDVYKRIEETNSFSTNIKMTTEYEKYGIGFCATNTKNDIVAVITSNGVYDNGVEINIKIEEEDRHKGLGTALSSKMILECLNKNKYPSWDAANLDSVGLAEKLGYEVDSEYRIYKINRG